MAKGNANRHRGGETPELAAAREYCRLMAERAVLLEKHVAAVLNKTPGRWALFALLRLSKAWEGCRHWSLVKRRRAVEHASFTSLCQLVAGQVTTGVVRKLERNCGTRYGLFSDQRVKESGAVDKLAAALGIEVDQVCGGPAPRLEDLINAAKAKESGA